MDVFSSYPTIPYLLRYMLVYRSSLRYDLWTHYGYQTTRFARLLEELDNHIMRVTA